MSFEEQFPSLHLKGHELCCMKSNILGYLEEDIVECCLDKQQVKDLLLSPIEKDINGLVTKDRMYIAKSLGIIILEYKNED